MEDSSSKKMQGPLLPSEEAWLQNWTEEHANCIETLKYDACKRWCLHTLQGSNFPLEKHMATE